MSRAAPPVISTGILNLLVMWTRASLTAPRASSISSACSLSALMGLGIFSRSMLYHRLDARSYFRDFARDGGLADLVERAREILRHFFRFVGRAFHRDHARAVLRRF